VVIRSFGLRFWRRKVTSSFFLWFHKRYQARPSDKVIVFWQKEKAQYVWSAGQKRRYRAHWKHMREANAKNDRGQNDMEAAKYCITRAAESSWWDWLDGSRPFHWRWPKEYQKTMRDGLKLWYKGNPPTYMQPQRTESDPVQRDLMVDKLSNVLKRQYFEGNVTFEWFTMAPTRV
jgi:hypothetical protein